MRLDSALVLLVASVPVSAQVATPGGVRPRDGSLVPGARLPGLLLARGFASDEGAVLADLDADGRMDLATVSDANLLVVLRLDLTRIGSSIVSPSVSGLRELVACDLDGDGDLDLAAIHPSGQVQLLVNVGAGQFSVGGTVPGEHFATSDLDLDGDMDLATVDPGGLSISIHRNQGSGTFVLSETVPVSTRAFSVFCADLIGGAGAPEIVCGTGVASVLFLPNTGTFNQALLLPLPAVATLGALTDFNGDSAPDLWAYTTFFPDMFSPPQHTPRIYLWSGTGFVTGPVGPSVTSLTGFAPGDVDGDGDPDLVLSYDGPPEPFVGFPSAGLRVQRNDGTSLVTSQVLARRRARGVVCADLNHDGRVEVARTGDNEIALYPNVDGVLNSERIHTIPFSWQGTADLDGNGYLDGFSGIGTQLRVLRMTGDQGTVRDYAAVSTATCAASLDSNLDGDLDIALGTVPLSLFPNNGSGLFTGAAATYPSPGAPNLLESVDLDGNGFPDVLALRQTANTLDTYLNTLGVLGAATSVATGSNPANLRVSDMDLDGDLDIVLPNRTTGTGGVALLRNDGFGGLAAPLHQVGGLDSLEIDVGDLDQDGDPDVLVRLSSTLRRLQNDGSGGLSAVGTITQATLGIALADLDRDRRVDVLAADSSGNLRWFRNAGNGAFDPARTHEIQLVHGLGYPVRLLVRDIDGDGDLDVSSLFTWLMNARN